jgi:hypothetical protein
VPSATDPKTFFCFTPVEQGFIITGYIFSAISAIFSIYKLHIFVQKRIRKLKEAKITPTLWGIIFLERTLDKKKKSAEEVPLCPTERAGPIDETRSSSNETVVRMVRDAQKQFEEQLKQQQQQQEEQSKQQQEQLKQYFQEQLIQQQQQIHQLMQQLQRSQQ